MARGAFDIDLTGARRVVRQLERELARSRSATRKAANRAMRKTLRQGKSAASKDIREVINLKKRVVDGAIRTEQVSQREVLGRLSVRNKRIDLAAFMTPAQIRSQYRRQLDREGGGIRVKVYKKKPPQEYRGVFLNVGKGDGKWHALRRAGRARYPVYIQYGPAITDEFREVLPAFTARANLLLEKNLEDALASVLRGF